jgi:ABC-type sugar transport system ATPase subunit
MNVETAAIIELQHISKRFPGVLALDDVSFSFLPGEVHAVLGENGAGKSTLMNILAGDLQPDSGKIYLDGSPVTLSSPLVSQRAGISVVYQELALCMNLSVAENIMLNSVANRSPLSFVRRGDMENAAREALSRLGITHLNPRTVVGNLSVAQQQLVEIAKAISQQARVLILDEPNSALTMEETEHLFEVIRQLRTDGVTIIYVSHRLEEVLQIADRISVMRDGRYISTMVNDGGITLDAIINQMVGRSIDHFFKRTLSRTVGDATALEIINLSSPPNIQSISLEAKHGEILGIAGLPDSGKDELVAAIFGLRSYHGQINVRGVPVRTHSPAAAINNGFALIPADRRGSGALLSMSVENNTVAASLGTVSQLGMVLRDKVRQTSQRYVKQLDTRIASHQQKLRTLSGGNQQKVILARGLATNPSILLLHEPTRGIDVGAKTEIYGILQRLASEGVTIIMVSSELPELISQCDRILVMYQGQISGEFLHEEATEEAILACAMGQPIIGTPSLLKPEVALP